MKVGFISLGCNKNLVDTENMLGILAQNGYEIVSDPAEAEIIVVNTCAFIDSAKEEAINTLLEMAAYKDENCKLLVAAGCLAQRYSEEIVKEIPEVDLVVGTTTFDKIAEGIEAALKEKQPPMVADINLCLPENLPRIRTTARHTAYLKIAEGCSNFCTYCAIPYIRGKYRSRSEEDILDEARALVNDGAEELIVVAQDTTRYGEDLYKERRISHLLRELCKIDGLKWIRVHYSYPEAVDDDFIEVIKTEEKIVKYLDIPVQHGNDEVLKRMGRHTSRKQILELVHRLRKEIPDITLRTSLIAGFPTESREQFEDLLEFMREARFDRVGVFAYSAEEGTAAARLPEQVDEEEKLRRRDEAMALAREISSERNKALVGKRITVLTEGFEDNLYFGRSEGESIEVDPRIYFGSERELSAGEFVTVEIVGADDYDLYGKQTD